MVLKKHVEGYEKFCELMKNFKSNGLPIFVYFSGSKLPSGESWCSDCIQGEVMFTCHLVLLGVALNKK